MSDNAIEPSSDGMADLMAALGGPADAATADPEKDDQQASGEGAETEAEDQAAEEAQAEQSDEQSGEIVDLDGRRISIPEGTPKELVETVRTMAEQLKADHTRKTQAAAEARKEADAIKQQLSQTRQLMERTAETWADARAAQQRLEQFKAVDWNALAESDNALATKLMASFQQAQIDLQAKSTAWQQSISQLRADEDRQAQESTSKRWQEATKAAREALGTAYTPAADKAAQKWLLTKAQTDDARALVQRFGDPVVLEAIVKAAQWDAAQAKPMKKVADAPKVIKPSAPQPAQTRRNAEGLERLKKTGRPSELIRFL